VDDRTSMGEMFPSLVISDFAGYPLRYPEPSFHYPGVPGLPVHTTQKQNNFFLVQFFWTMTGNVLF